MINIEKIKELMKEKAITNRDMACTVGISEAMMSYILQGLRVPTVSVFIGIAKRLSVKLDELVT